MNFLARLRCLFHAYRALRAGKDPDDLNEMLDHMAEDAENEVIREFATDAKERIGTNVVALSMDKEGMDFSNEATVFFHLGVRWERHDIFTGDDL